MTEKVYSSSTPIKLNIDPVSKNSNATAGSRISFERIYHSIYSTSIEEVCSPDDLKIHGFTHIIYIDKHVIANNGSDTHINIRHMCSAGGSAIVNLPGSSNGADCCSSFNQEMPIDDDAFTMQSPSSKIKMLDRADFQILDLNFGETSYLTTVLPNCYKAVKFIETATKQNGAVLLIDCIGGNQKCITIVIGFLMYKYNKNFLNAFKLIKRLHPNIELDKYFTTQLYEYEPILQVQRSQLAGNSCSRELRCSLLKRKNRFDDNYTNHTDAVIPIRSIDYVDHFMGNIEQSTDILMEQ